jgi:hypothetical protein
MVRNFLLFLVMVLGLTESARAEEAHSSFSSLPLILSAIEPSSGAAAKSSESTPKAIQDFIFTQPLSNSIRTDFNLSYHRNSNDIESKTMDSTAVVKLRVNF